MRRSGWLPGLLWGLSVITALGAPEILTNAHLRAGRGITVGWSTSAIPGEVRYNSGAGRLEVFTGSWDPVGSSGGSGNVAMSNAWSVLYSDGATNAVELALGEAGKALVSSGTTSAPAFQWPVVPITNFVPLTAYAQYRQVYYAALRSTFYARLPISSTEPYTTHPSYTNVYPIPGYDGSVVWDYVSRGGMDGAAGAPGTATDGTDGLDGFGNMLYGPWQLYKGYAYDTGALVVVSYGGRWYDCIQSSTGVYPSAVGASNYWSASIYAPMSGTLYSTNLTDRGAWSSSETGYASNDVVVYAGNTFYAHTNRPGTGTPPTVDADGIGQDNAYWDVRTSRGYRGATGAPGKDGEVIHLTNIVQWTILDAGPSTSVTNSQNATNRLFYFDYWVDGVVGGTGVYHWGAVPSEGGGTATNETDPVFINWLATNAYVKTEVDPKFSTWLGTNAYVKAEVDPTWAAASNLYARTEAATFGSLSVTSEAVFGDQAVNFETMQKFVADGVSASVTDAVQYVITETGVSKPNSLRVAGATNTFVGGTSVVYVLGFLPTSGGYLSGRVGIDCGTNALYLRGSPTGGRIWLDVRGGGAEAATDLVVSNAAKIVIADIDRCQGGGVQIGGHSWIRGVRGVAVGYAADADADGASIGYSALSDDYGVCLLKSAANTGIDRRYAVAAGYETRVYRDGIGLGRGASAFETNIAIGAMALARDGGANLIAIGPYTALPGATNSVAIGAYVTNRVSNSAALRGSLYLEGGTGIYARATFGSGNWNGPIEFGGSIVLANVQTTHPAAVTGKAQIYSFYDGTNTVIYTMRSDGTYTLQTSHRNGRPAFVHGNVYDGWEETIYLDGLRDGMKKLKDAKNKNEEDTIVASLSISNALPPALRRDWKAEQKALAEVRQKDISAQMERKAAADLAVAAWAAMSPADKKKYVGRGGKPPTPFSEAIMFPYQEVKR